VTPPAGGSDLYRPDFSSEAAARGYFQELIAEAVAASAAMISLVPGQPRVRFGTDNLFFNGSSASDPLTIAHGLPAAPVFVCAMGRAGLGVFVFEYTTVPDATNIYLQGATGGAAIGPGTVPIYWLAVST
jgi:hypothetical protein